MIDNNKNTMPKKEISLHQQKYLETVYELCNVHGHAHTKAIAEQLNVRMASVTEAIRNLASLGLLNYKVRKTITLTEEGEAIAVKLEKRHNVLSDFFYNILGCDKEHSEEIACSVEHVVDENIETRLKDFVEFLKNDLVQKDGFNPAMEFKKRYTNCNGK